MVRKMTNTFLAFLALAVGLAIFLPTITAAIGSLAMIAGILVLTVGAVAAILVVARGFWR